MKLLILLLLTINTIQAQETYEWIVQPQYSRAYSFADGHAIAIGKSKGAVIINAKGLIQADFKRFVGRQVEEGRIFYTTNIWGGGDCYFYNVLEKALITDVVYDGATRFSEGLSIVQKKGETYAIDKFGAKVFQIPEELNDAFFQAYADGMAPFYIGRLGGESWGAINNNGEITVKPKYKYVSDFVDGVAAFQSGSYWGVIDKQGQVVLAPKYDWINTFSEGLAVFRQKNRHGFIDVKGEKKIPIMYKQAHSFSEGLAAVENDSGKWGFINKQNEYVLQPLFTQAFSFHEGLARVENKSGKIGYINKLGELAIDYQFEDGRDLSEGMIAIKKGGKWGYIKLINPPEIQKIEAPVVVEQPKSKEKKLKSGKGIVVTGKEIQLAIFDFEKEDGDSISLFFNEKPILENYKLKNIPVILKINLDSIQDNKLVLHAHNLGRKPPNTAAIKITDSRGKVQRVEMISDLENSDVLYFFKKQQDVSGQIDYAVSYFDVEDRFKNAVEQLPAQETILFKGNRLRKDLKNSFILYDNALKKSYLCKDEPAGKVAYYGPLSSKEEIELLDEKYKILDYICRKAIVTKRGVATEVYYTTDLPFEYSPFEGVPGVVLKYTEKTHLGMKTVTAKKVSFSEKNDSLFSLEGYELQSKAEKQKQKLAEMRAIIEARKKGVEDAKAKLLNKPAPKTTFKFLDGTTKSLSDYAGKVVVLNFWFVECMPCKIEMPKLNSVVEFFKGKDVVFVSIARNKADEVKAFLKKTSFNYLPSIGEDHFDKYGVKMFPSSVIINREGNVIYFSSGLKKDIDKELEKVIQAALE